MEKTNISELKDTIIDEIKECNDIATLCQIGETLGLEMKLKVIIEVPSQDTQYEVAQ